MRVHCGNSVVPVLMSLQWTFRDTHSRRTTLLRADRTATRLIFEHHGYTSIFVMFFGSGWSSWFLSNQHIFPKYFPPKRKSVKLCRQHDWLWKKSAHTVTYTKCKNLFKIWNISRIKYSYLPWQVLFQYKFPKFVQIDIEYVVIAVIEESQFPSVRTASSFGILCRILTTWIRTAATASTSLRKTNR